VTFTSAVPSDIHREDDAFDLDHGVGSPSQPRGRSGTRVVAQQLRLERRFSAPRSAVTTISRNRPRIGWAAPAARNQAPLQPRCTLDHRDWVESNDPNAISAAEPAPKAAPPAGFATGWPECQLIELLLDNDPANCFTLAGTEERRGTSGSAAKRKEHRPTMADTSCVRPRTAFHSRNLSVAHHLVHARRKPPRRAGMPRRASHEPGPRWTIGARSRSPS